MHTQVLHTERELDALTDPWISLCRRDPHATFYASPDFVRPWWGSFQSKPGMELCVVCVHEAGRLVALAPLAMHLEQRGTKQVRVLRFAGRGDYMTFLVDPDSNHDAVLKRVFRVIRDDLTWDTVWLSNIPTHSPVSAHLLRSELNPFFEFWIENPYIDLRQFRDFEDFRSTQVPSKASTYRNKFARERGIRFHVFHGNERDIFEQIAELHRLEKEYLVATKGRDERHSLFEDAYRRRHIKAIFDTTDRAVTFAYSDPQGTLLAYRTCFRDGRRLLSWNSAYHPDVAHYRPGKVLQYDILEHLFESQDTDLFDLGAGRYSWKFEWTANFTITYRLHLTAETMRTAAQPGQGSPSASPAPPRPVRPAATRAAGDETAAVVAPPPALPPASSRRRGRLRTHLPPPVAVPLRRARSAYTVVASRRRLLRARPTIWYIPHPDDETIFMGGSLHANRLSPNVLVLLSRGAASQARQKINSRVESQLDVPSFTAAREREFHAAVRQLDLRDAEVVVLDLPDGAITSQAVRAVVRRMERAHPGWSHRTMSFLDPHRDHAAAGKALRTARTKGEIADCVSRVPQLVGTRRARICGVTCGNA